MGTDDIFHKRKAREAESLRRKTAKRAAYDIVLIVCEGAKTEPYYFLGLRKHLLLSNANIVIADKKTGIDPLSVVNFAIKEFNKDPCYDRVYCVFDKDKHTTYPAALDKIRSTPRLKKATFHAITSIPCFEIWLLLHYTFTSRSFSATGDASNCALVEAEIRGHISGYQKGNRNIFELVKDKLDNAITNAKRLDAFHQTSGTDNPSTKVHELVEYLQNLKNKIYEAKQ
ncbi:MAG: RloB domain-containing protein [Deltaproteobacteria bacterium]|nr:RloB domain-containing protein [Deltaproteobacteria bacterium]